MFLLFWYYSCQRSGLLKALSLWRSKLLGGKLRAISWDRWDRKSTDRLYGEHSSAVDLLGTQKVLTAFQLSLKTEIEELPRAKSQGPRVDGEREDRSAKWARQFEE